MSSEDAGNVPEFDMCLLVITAYVSFAIVQSRSGEQKHHTRWFGRHGIARRRDILQGTWPDAAGSVYKNPSFARSPCHQV